VRAEQGRAGECLMAMTTDNKVRDLQRALYRAAKAEAERRR
jgi:hypothetical protein